MIPNSHFRDPFDYAYSGFELYFIDGHIEIGSVSRDSPAEKAGIKEGDVVVAVNNDFSQNFNKYKSLILASNSKVKLILRRNEELIQVEMKVKSIY